MMLRAQLAWSTTQGMEKVQEEALQLAAEIVTARARLNDLEAKFSKLVGGQTMPRPPVPSAANAGVGASSSPPQKPKTTFSPSPTSVASRVRLALRSAPERIFSIAELSSDLNIDAVQLRSELGRLARAKKDVKNVGRGQYSYRQPGE